MGDAAEMYDDWLARFDDDDEEGATCNRCGKRGLEWLNTGVRWRLYDGNKPHQCAIVASPDDFEDLDA